MLSDVFDFTDPELWKSNSFAALRPRLIIHLEAVIAKLERECAAVGSRRQRAWYKFKLAENMPRLTKAREIYAALTGASPAHDVGEHRGAGPAAPALALPGDD